NAYLESETHEKVVFVAGDEFGPLAGHLFQIVKALYGLKSSGKRWHDRLHDVLRDLGFTPSKAEEDIWMKDMGDHYDYIAVYVDDLLIASKDPKAIIVALESDPINFKLKGTGPLSFHLGCDYFRDEDGTRCYGPKKYITRMSEAYVRMFGSRPSTKHRSPLAKNDHPELDTSDLLDEDGIARYQSLIGILQWTITLGRFDVGTAVMTMSGFRVAPREGHMVRLRRICGYLVRFSEGCIRIRMDKPDYSGLPEYDQDWSRSVYGNVREAVPSNCPEPKGKSVCTTTYKDANLYHDVVTGRAVTGVLHFINKTPIDWYSKKQSTVETATYGSEFSSAKTAIQQIQGLRTTLRYLGVPVDSTSYMFGDNGSVVTSSTMPDSQLNRRHLALSYHYVREAIASGMVAFYHMPGEINPSDVLSKHWGYTELWSRIKALLFCPGDTARMFDDAPPVDDGELLDGGLPEEKGER
ncbi:MAG: reverse transcriptase domain-containing protein, partial [Cetobacterium sp.]